MNSKAQCQIMAVLLGFLLGPTSVCSQAATSGTSRLAARAYGILEWRLAVAARSFQDRTLFEAVELTASLGQKSIEGFSEQKVSTGIPKNLD